VPAGTSLDVTFLTGVDTTTDIQTSNPAPALLSISDIRQVVPESAQKEIGSCVAVVAGVADDKAASRVYFRASSLRCLDAQGNYAYEANLEGYLVGQGGKLGISRSGVERGEQAQLVLTRDTGVFSPRQLGQVPSQR
jgi:hypothetical protein